MIKKIVAFLSAGLLLVGSVFCSYTVPVFAAGDPRYYVAAGPMIASLLSAYGYMQSEGNRKLAEYVAQIVVDAGKAGRTVLRNGVQSIAIAIQDDTTYVSKDFAEWVYDWCVDHNLSEVKSGSGYDYPSYSDGQNVSFENTNINWQTYAQSCGFPADVVSAFQSSGKFNTAYNTYCCAISRVVLKTNPDYSYTAYRMGGVNLSGSYNITSYTQDGVNYLGLDRYKNIGNVYQYEIYDNGETYGPVRGTAFGMPVSSGYETYVESSTDQIYTYVSSSTFNSSYVTSTPDYTVSADAPAKNKTFTEYISNPASWEGLESWGKKVKEVPIDGTNTAAIPVAIPIDIGIGDDVIAVPIDAVITGASIAIDAALSIPQAVAREGVISNTAAGEIADANTAVDNVIEVADAQPIVSDVVGWGIDYVKPHLTNVFRKFPFSIPYDFYLLLKSMYGTGGNTRKLRAVKISNAPEDIFNLDPSSIPIAVDFDYVLPDQIGVPDPAAPKFMYDITVNYFGKPLHAEGTLDLAPFGGYFKLLKMGLAIIWIMDLLLFTQQQISNMKGGQ